jgi:hypothetical protein
MKNEKKVFRSRISVLLSVFILATFSLVSIPALREPSCTGLCILGGAFLFIVLIFTGMRYVISDNKLYLKMWFIPNGSKNIADIVSVRRTYNPLSSPAASLKRLEVHFKTGLTDWLISPVREKEFIEALKAINPDISVNIPERKGKWRIWDWDI